MFTDMPPTEIGSIQQMISGLEMVLHARLRFDFSPWNAACRLRDAQDLVRFQFK